MSVMKERVAKAICTEYGFPDKPQLCYEHALAAIAAMRKPTPEMIKAGETDTGVDPGYAIQCWENMIDAALSG